MRLTFLLFCVATATTSCYHVYYAPNTANAPLLSEKGETRVNVLYCSGGDSEFDGVELQGAVAVTKNIGVMTNFFSAGKTQAVTNYSSGRSHDETGRGNYVEVGGGYFNKLGERWIGEIYGGPGIGYVRNEYGDNDFSKVNVFKFFVQPAIGYKVKHFEFAFVPKFSFVNWNVKKDNVVLAENQNVRFDLDYIKGHKNFMAFEPALIIRAGGSDFKFQGALSFSSRSKYQGESMTETLNASFGISLDIK